MSENYLIVVPTYNEAQNIELLLDSLCDVSSDILVVDDNSPDGTSNLVKDKMIENSSINLLTRKKKDGLGSAYREGFEWGLKYNYEYFIEMDADFSHRVVDLVEMIKEAKGYDLIIGSRYVNGGGSTGWTFRRKLLSQGANRIAQILLRTKINDLTSGFRIYTREALNKIEYKNTETNDQAKFLIDQKIDVLKSIN